MDFTFQDMRRSEDSDERITVATRVEFEDTAEIAFAIACVDALRLYLEFGDHDIDQERCDIVSESYKEVSERLSSLTATSTQLNQALLPEGMALTTARFAVNGEEIANAVRSCIDTVRVNADVREYFPADRIDLLTLFAPDEQA